MHARARAEAHSLRANKKRPAGSSKERGEKTNKTRARLTPPSLPRCSSCTQAARAPSLPHRKHSNATTQMHGMLLLSCCPLCTGRGAASGRTIAGRPSGMTATAMDTALSKAPFQSSPARNLASRKAATMIWGEEGGAAQGAALGLVQVGLTVGFEGGDGRAAAGVGICGAWRAAGGSRWGMGREGRGAMYAEG
jgi:hypothetical protein